MEMVSKPCQDRFLHPILVHSIEKKEKIQVAKWGTPKKIYKNKNKKTLFQKLNFGKAD